MEAEVVVDDGPPELGLEPQELKAGCLKGQVVPQKRFASFEASYKHTELRRCCEKAVSSGLTNHDIGRRYRSSSRICTRAKRTCVVPGERVVSCQTFPVSFPGSEPAGSSQDKALAYKARLQLQDGLLLLPWQTLAIV